MILANSYTSFERFFVLFVSLHVLPLRAKDRQGGFQHERGVVVQACAVHPVLSDHLVVPIYRPSPRDAQVHVVVLSSPKRSIEAADGLENGAPEHHRDRWPAGTFTQQLEIMILLGAVLLLRERKGRSVNRDGPVVAGDEGALRVGVQVLQTHLKRPGEQPVVGVQKHQVLAFAPPQPSIARRSEPLVVLPEETHSRVALSYL